MPVLAMGSFVILKLSNHVVARNILTNLLQYTITEDFYRQKANPIIFISDGLSGLKTITQRKAIGIRFMGYWSI